MGYLPLFLNVTGVLTLVVGGGSVGRRRIEKILSCGGRVRVVDPQPQPSWFQPEWGTWWAEPFHTGHLEGVQLVFACATPEVNERVCDAALARGLWIGNSSQPEAGNLIVPASGERGLMAVAIHTHGASPRYAAKTLEAILNSLSDAELTKLEVLKELRTRFKKIADPTRKAKMLALLDQFAQ